MPFATAEAENVAKLYKNESPTKREKVYIKLHKGNPGAACTSNAATETTRKEATLTGTGTLKNVAELLWEGVAATETYSHWSAWTAATSGSAVFYGEFDEAKEVKVGEDARIKAGELEIPIKTS